MALPSASLLAQSILSGIFIGSLYGLLGLGLSLSWGILRQINLAHFALAFLGAYLCYQLSAVGGMDPLVTLLVIVPSFFALGVALQWIFARFRISVQFAVGDVGLTVIIESVIQSDLDRGFPAVLGLRRYDIPRGAMYVPMPELLDHLAVADAVARHLGGASLHGSWPARACGRGGRSHCRRIRRRPESPRLAAPGTALRWPVSQACALH
jgi:branched-chain amino acid transport system permease protein